MRKKLTINRQISKITLGLFIITTTILSSCDGTKKVNKIDMKSEESTKDEVWSNTTKGLKLIELNSEKTRQTYTVGIWLPESYETSKDKTYPVIYQLDGEGSLNTSIETVRGQSVSGDLEEVIIVGVYNYGAKSRWFDFTPTKADKFTQTLEVTARDFPTGGSEQFYAFIVSELMPKINTEYRTDNKKNVLYGHSLGGLFCLSTLQKESSPFTHYLISSPSIWWNDREIFENPLPKRAFEPVVYLTVGEMEQIPTNLPAEIIKLFPKEVIINDGNARMTEGITDAYDYLKAQKNVEVYAHIEEGEVHMSSNIPSFSRGIRTLLNGNNRDELRRRSSERPTLPW